MRKYDYLIVGSGLFGSVCAYELSKKGFSVLVVEKRNHVGGNIYTSELEGIEVHTYGPHIFHTSNKNIWEYVNRFGEFNNFINSPIARYKNEIYNLPFNMNTFSKIWKDVFTPEQAMAKIDEERQKFFVKNPTNLEEQAINCVGTTIYEKLIKGYTAKQWGKDCKNLPPFIIKRLPIRFIYNNNYFDDTYQGVPICGYTKIIEKMLYGIKVILNCDFFDHKDELIQSAYNIIYTGPIDRYFSYKYGALEYRSIRFETEIINTSNYQGNAVVNYTDYDVPFTRIIEHKHFYNLTNIDKTIISKEYSFFDDESHCEPFYPINDEKNMELYKKYKEEAKLLKNVFFGGRLGQYKYLNMDQTIESALELLKAIIK